MKKIIVVLIYVIFAISCQVSDGGNEILVSGKDYTVACTGDDVVITTGGVAYCTLTEPNTATSDFITLYLRDTQPVVYNGSWYSFESRNDGKELHLEFEKNTTSSERHLFLTLTEADLYTQIRIVQYGESTLE